jgi:hypothetical protein
VSNIKNIVGLAKARMVKKITYRQFIAQLAAEIVSVEPEEEDTLVNIIISGAAQVDSEEGEG